MTGQGRKAECEGLVSPYHIWLQGEDGTVNHSDREKVNEPSSHISFPKHSGICQEPCRMLRMFAFAWQSKTGLVQAKMPGIVKLFTPDRHPHNSTVTGLQLRGDKAKERAKVWLKKTKIH